MTSILLHGPYTEILLATCIGCTTYMQLALIFLKSEFVPFALSVDVVGVHELDVPVSMNLY